MWRMDRLNQFHMLLPAAAILLFMCHSTLAISEDGKGHSEDSKFSKYPILMPKVHPYRKELYLCTPVKVDSTKSYYIVGYEPNGTMNTAHHMLLYGCGEPGDKRPVWDCGEMSHAENSVEENKSPCAKGSNSQIIYAWARDAPVLNLPQDVGFKVGRDSPIKYIVLQVHYAHKFPAEKTDDSGVFVKYTLQPLPRLAGIFLLGTSGYIPAHTTEYMDTACRMREKKTIYPFAYRTHTHGLGRVVSGYRVRRGPDGHHHWVQLGKRNPLTPQMFYPLENTEPIVYGDIMAARCVMESDRDRITYIGPTNDDEMCNFYIMYYTENEDPLETKYCFTSGPPSYRWNRTDSGLEDIPEYAASHLD